jgi:hypothetical protein
MVDVNGRSIESKLNLTSLSFLSWKLCSAKTRTSSAYWLTFLVMGTDIYKTIDKPICDSWTRYSLHVHEQRKPGVPGHRSPYTFHSFPFLATWISSKYGGYTENAVARACMRVQVFTVMHGRARSSRSSRSWHMYIQSSCRTMTMVCLLSALLLYVPKAHMFRNFCELSHRAIAFEFNQDCLGWVRNKNIAQ